MKKLISAAILALFASVCAHAQLGVTGGLTSSSTTLESAAADLTSGSLNQYHVGIVYKIGIGNILAIQPGIVYNVKGSNFNISDIASTSMNFKTGFIEVPVQVQLGFGFGKAFRVYGFAEPFVGYAITNEVDLKTAASVAIEPEKTWDNVKSRLEYGIGLGAGVELFRHLQVSVKYFWNFGDLYGSSNPTADSLWQDVIGVNKNNVGGIAASVTVLF